MEPCVPVIEDDAANAALMGFLLQSFGDRELAAILALGAARYRRPPLDSQLLLGEFRTLPGR